MAISNCQFAVVALLMFCTAQIAVIQAGEMVRRTRMIWNDFEKYPELKYDLPVKTYIGDYFDKAEKIRIVEALAELECKTCLNFDFVPDLPGEDEKFIHIRKVNETSSAGSGYIIAGFTDRNVVNIGLFTRQTIVHEVLHAMGADHTMTRPDRDEFIKIIDPTDQETIIKDGITYGFPYEYDSIMHYRNLERYIVLKEPIDENTAKMGSNLQLTENDQTMIRKAYCNGENTTVLPPEDIRCHVAEEIVALEKQDALAYSNATAQNQTSTNATDSEGADENEEDDGETTGDTNSMDPGSGMNADTKAVNITELLEEASDAIFLALSNANSTLEEDGSLNATVNEE